MFYNAACTFLIDFGPDLGWPEGHNVLELMGYGALGPILSAYGIGFSFGLDFGPVLGTSWVWKGSQDRPRQAKISQVR